MAVFLVVAVLAVGVLFMRLHSLPDHIAHRGQKVQMEIVCVLCLLSLFTGVHIFWVAALLLALIDIPDFSGPLERIAGSVEKMAGIEPGQGPVEVTGETSADRDHHAGVTVLPARSAGQHKAAPEAHDSGAAALLLALAIAAPPALAEKHDWVTGRVTKIDE